MGSEVKQSSKLSTIKHFLLLILRLQSWLSNALHVCSKIPGLGQRNPPSANVPLFAASLCKIQFLFLLYTWHTVLLLGKFLIAGLSELLLHWMNKSHPVQTLHCICIQMVYSYANACLMSFAWTNSDCTKLQVMH